MGIKRMRVISALAGLSTLGLFAVQDTPANEVATYASEADGPAAAGVSPGGTESRSGEVLEEIVVTARKREENLQNVPDSITAFTATKIVDAGIEHIADFLALTPNLTFQDGSAFYPGFFNLSMRGIGNAQDGWPSVAYIVDGVPADSLDSINSGSLEDIERIEVLRGPQSALYGAGAIAGAINVITKQPTNEWESKARLSYGNGDDRQAAATVSGPLIRDTLLFRVTATWRDNDGLFTSPSNGLDLGFQQQKEVRTVLLIKPTDALQIDLRARYDKEHDGTSYEDIVPSIASADDFNPVYDARRGFAGSLDREFANLSARVKYDFSDFSLISVSGFSHVDQSSFSSFCYDDPSDPLYPGPGGGAQCLFGAAYGKNAVAGEPVDEYTDGPHNIRTITEDLRLASSGDGPLTWTVGASGMWRRVVEASAAGLILAPDETQFSIFQTWDVKRDRWWGLYGQLSAKVTRKVELTLAGRYDDTNVFNNTYTDGTLATPVPVRLADGTLVDTVANPTKAFQPKGQVSYHFTDDVMSYLTISKGFRAGFFASGEYAVPEHTVNYEIGLKSSWLDHRMTANASAFYIDYSNQQFQTFSNTAPFISVTNIPKTKIKGLEYESALLVSSHLTLGAGLGYLDARVDDGSLSPNAPHFNANANADFSAPLSAGWAFHLHLDDRYSSPLYLSTEDQQLVPSKNYLNGRAGVSTDRYSFAVFVRNATDTRAPTSPGVELPAGFLRYQNLPRTYGGEVRVTF
jgi:iron complex outermembrane receptor protein